MSSVFSEQILADKLAKLNSTQQCIETLSHWCIFHRNKAQLVVKTWEKQFHASQMALKVPLLYLANDILQNSKRKGNEFVSEFWKVLPAALKDVSQNGDDRGKKTVSRLVGIWEERRVFGSRAKSLRDVMLGEEAPPPLDLSKKRPRAVKIVKRDSRSIRTKLSIGGAAEKIVSAYHSVLTEHMNEEAEMSKCKSVISRIRKIEKDVDVACTSGKDPKRKTLAKELEEEETFLRQYVEKLKSVEASRLTLITQLIEALHEQESELENVRTQMQVAQAQADEACHMRKRLNDEDYVPKPSTASTTSLDTAKTPKRTAASIAAEVADKLTASSSSQMIMHSVLSTFAAEEAKNAGLSHTAVCTAPPAFFPAPAGEPVPKSEPQAQSHTGSYQPVLVPNQNTLPQPQYRMAPNVPSQQYLQPPGGIVNPFGYGNVPLMPSGPPLMMNAMVPLTQPPPQMTQPPQAPSFQPLQRPGMMYYAPLHHS